MNSGIFLGIDHGGSTTTAVIFDPERGKLASASVRMPKSMPGVGLVEHHPDDFVKTSLASAQAALGKAGLAWSDVQGIGIANQGETSMAWSAETGEPIGPALSWEDKRTDEICRELAGRGVDALVRSRTGVILDPYFSASKFKWLKKNAGAAGALRFGGTDAYLMHRLTAGATYATEPGTASRTALFNIHSLMWDLDLLDAFSISEEELPAIRPSCGEYGVARHEGLGAAAVPILANVVDAHAALFAQGCHDGSSVKATYGTGAFIEVNTGPRFDPPDGNLPVFVAWELAGKTDFTLEGGVFSVGSAIDWAIRVGLAPSAEALADLAASVSDSGGVWMVPSLSGLSAPHWQPSARGSLTGFGLDTGSGHIVRALLDGIAFQCADIIKALNARSGGMVQEIRADGGPTRNSYLMQRQADLLAMPVSVSLEPDMTGLGAAMLAAVGAGQMTVDDAKSLHVDRRIYEPSLSSDESEMLWAEWDRQVRDVVQRASDGRRK